MKEKFQGSDYRFLAVCLALLAGTTWFSVRNFYRAFPEASIDFRVNRTEGQTIAGRFLADQGYAVGDYRQASSFTFDDEAKTFLEREVGLEEANRLMGSRIKMWRWSYRWFRPLQKEEFGVSVTARGELAGFRHELPEDAARPATGADEARALAEQFLRDRMHRDPASLEFVEVSEAVRPHRTDRTYTWKERDFSIHDATGRVEVTLLGNEVAGYHEYLKIPEQWSRDYERLRSKNQAASTVDAALLVGMVLGLVVVIVMRVRRQDIRWRRAAFIGVIGMVLSFCSHLNQMPLAEFEYPTTDSYASFMTSHLFQGVISALGAGGLLFILAAAAEPLYREMFRDKVSLGNLFRMRALRTKRFFLGSVLGVTLTAIFIAYQTAFYIVAYKFGAWSPADVPYSDLLNTKFPWLFVLFGGFLPAVSEELMFRMFGIPFFRKLARSTAVAVVAAGFIWGFGHAAYPQQPFYIRGVEVGIGGVALGLIMLRWGILPTLVWHYSVDAMYSAMLLLRSQSLYFRLSGAASAGVIVLPLVAALVAYWRFGGFEPENGLLNSDEEGPQTADEQTAPVAVEAPAGWSPLPGWARGAAALLCAAGLLAMTVKLPQFGESPNYWISQEQALAAANAYLRGQGLDPNAFHHVVYPAVHWGGADELTGKYFLERWPVENASRILALERPVHYWGARYFKSLDREEVQLAIHPETGKVLGYGLTLPEDQPGADLSPASARQIAVLFAGSQGRDLSAMELKESNSEKKKARRDHTFVWEARGTDPRNVDAAHFRVSVEVSGDRPSEIRAFWKLPEDYERARSRQNAISIAVLVLRFGVMVGGVVWGLWLLIQNIRNGEVRWGLTMRIAIPMALVALVGPLLSIQMMLLGYNTAIPLETFQALTYLSVAMSVVFAFLLQAASAGLLTANFPDSLKALRASYRRVAGRDAALALLAAIGVALLVHQVQLGLMARFHTVALFSPNSPDLIVSAAPALAAVAGAVQQTVESAALLAVIALVAMQFRSRWGLAAIAMLMAFVGLPLDVRTMGELLLHYVVGLLGVGAAVAFCVIFARRNYLAYALIIWVSSMRGALGELLGTPAPGAHLQGWIAAAVLAAVLLWALAPALSGKAEVSEAAAVV